MVDSTSFFTFTTALPALLNRDSAFTNLAFYSDTSDTRNGCPDQAKCSYFLSSGGRTTRHPSPFTDHVLFYTALFMSYHHLYHITNKGHFPRMSKFGLTRRRTNKKTKVCRHLFSSKKIFLTWSQQQRRHQIDQKLPIVFLSAWNGMKRRFRQQVRNSPSLIGKLECIFLIKLLLLPNARQSDNPPAYETNRLRRSVKTYFFSRLESFIDLSSWPWCSKPPDSIKMCKTLLWQLLKMTL